MALKQFRKQPKKVEQIHESGLNDCWAAALSSWLDEQSIHSTQEQLITQYVKYVTDALVLKSDNFQKVADEINIKMSFKKFNNGNELTSDYLAERLAVSCLYLGYAGAGSPMGHVVVVYGVDHPQGKEASISLMDPLLTGGGYRIMALNELKGKLGVVGWRWKPFTKLTGDGYW